MKPANSIDSEARAPSAVEVATLAANFLPKIGLPENWETEHPITLQGQIGKPTGIPYPENPGYRRPAGWRSPWEVLCGEAVLRARMLLDAAGGLTRPKVLDYEQAGSDYQHEMSRIQTRSTELKQMFDKIANEGQPLPLLDVLKVCLPKSEEPTRMKYWDLYLREWQQDYNRRHNIVGEFAIADQSKRFVDRDEFPHLILSFSAALAERKDAWRKQLLRQGGKQTQLRKRTEASKQGYAPVTGKAASRIHEAGKRHSAAGKRKK